MRLDGLETSRLKQRGEPRLGPCWNAHLSLQSASIGWIQSGGEVAQAGEGAPL